jgi:SAM-dependent methyltransferase
VTRWDATDAPRGDAYDARWRAMEAAGQNPHGEADFVGRYAAPASVLDAGCGTGRVARELARRGCHTVGVDLDAAMLATARAQAPDLEWHQADLADLDLRDPTGGRRRFDVVVMAGNVMIFVAPGTEALVVARLAGHLTPGGHLIAGFQVSGRLPPERYDECAVAAGLTPVARYATWQGDPWPAAGDYLVAVHQAPPVLLGRAPSEPM